MRLLRWAAIATLIVLGSAIGGAIMASRQADASRNSAGGFSLYTPGNPVVTGTTIGTSWANNTLSDIATEMTDSLSRSGKGGMLAALRGIDGTVAAPALSFTSETGSGLFRNATNDVRMSVAGSANTYWNTTGLGIGVAPVTPLHVQGAYVSQKGQVYVKGISDHGFVNVDTDTPTTKQAGFGINSNGTQKWQMYVPANGSDLRFLDTVDRVIISSGGLTIGASGTAISASIRGSASITPGSLGANACNEIGPITVTGAVAGAECAVGIPGAEAFFSFQCRATSNACEIKACNVGTASHTPTSGTYSCRVFNP